MSMPFWQEDLEGLEVPGQQLLRLPDEQTDTVTKPTNEAKRSIRFMLDAALRYGKVRGYTELLDQVAALSQYKPYNALLILLQRPGATYVLHAHQWGEKYGRLIRPNEQPLVLLQTGGPVMFLFDVSQTEATPDSRPLPSTFENPFAMEDAPQAERGLDWVIQNAIPDGVRVLPAGHGLSRAGCIWTTSSGATQVGLGKGKKEQEYVIRYETLLNRAHTPTEQLATLAHELGHLYCGHVGTHDKELWSDRSRGMTLEQEELEAESVARLAFKRLHPDVALPPYLEQYFGTVPDIPGSDLERVLTAAGRIIEMTQGFAPRRPKPRTKAAEASPPMGSG